MLPVSQAPFAEMPPSQYPTLKLRVTLYLATALAGWLTLFQAPRAELPSLRTSASMAASPKREDEPLAHLTSHNIDNLRQALPKPLAGEAHRQIRECGLEKEKKEKPDPVSSWGDGFSDPGWDDCDGEFWMTNASCNGPLMWVT